MDGLCLFVYYVLLASVNISVFFNTGIFHFDINDQTDIQMIFISGANV